LEKINEIKIYLELRLKMNINYLINNNIYNQSQILTEVITNVCNLYNVYASFKLEKYILIITFTQFTSTKYRETLSINLNKYIRKEKLKFIL
jgi:hypothetical protein